MNRFIPITKVDAERREVWGVAAEEAPDKSDEVMDYEWSKPNFEKWSQAIQLASGGKSLGNVRAMHQPVAAGKIIDMHLDDATKTIHIGTKIVDDNEWNKVVEGVYTGFSVGGKYGEKRKRDGRLLRYEAVPEEISIVDNPCMHGAVFTMVKAGGAMEMVKFVGEPADEALAKVAGDLSELAKAGARHSASDMHLLQSIHDSACSLGAACAEATKAAGPGDLKKDADEASWIAWSAGQAVGDISSALAFVAGLSASMTVSDPGTATKLQTAAQLLTSALNDQVTKQGAATQAAVADMKEDEALEEQVEAKTEETSADASTDAAAGTAAGSATETTAAATTDGAAKAEGTEGAEGGDAGNGDGEKKEEEDEDMNKSIQAAVDAAVQKSLATFGDALLAKAKDILAAGAEPLIKLNGTGGDLAKRFDAIEAGLGALTDRLVKVETAPRVAGPVLREVNPSGGMDGDQAMVAALDKLIADETDPVQRQNLMAKRADLVLRQVHRGGGRTIA